MGNLRYKLASPSRSVSARRRYGKRAETAPLPDRMGHVAIDWRSPALSELHPLIRERLSGVGLRDLGQVPDLCSWQSLLKGISEDLAEFEGNLHRHTTEAPEAAANGGKLAAADRVQRASLEREVRGAADVQRKLMPPAKTSRHAGIEIASLFHPANICGGDWWSWYPLEDDAVLIVIADVTGHGFAPAMMTGFAKGATDLLVRTTPSDELTPARVLAELNRSLCDAGPESLVMTCAVARLDPRRGVVQFASAGHPLPYVVRTHGDRVGLSQLVASGVPLGTALDSTYSDSARPLRSGDFILWYTDGLTETVNAKDEPYGDKRLRSVLMGEAKNADPASLRDAIWRAVSSFLGATRPDDDVTLVATRVD